MTYRWIWEHQITESAGSRPSLGYKAQFKCWLQIRFVLYGDWADSTFKYNLTPWREGVGRSWLMYEKCKKGREGGGVAVAPM